jgi:type II secretory pathway pseudopilin PulG
MLLLLTQQFQKAQQEQAQQRQQMQQLLHANQQLQGQVAALQQERKDETPTHQALTTSTGFSPKTVTPSKPDTYNGSRRTPADVWLFGLETFFTATQTNGEEQRICFAAAQLRDSAATWWRKVLHDNQEIHTWQEFKEAFVKQFIPVATKETARTTLHNMTQHNSTVGYCDAFSQALLQLPSGDMSPADQLFLFKRGLKKDIAAHLAVMRPKTLEEAMSFAQQVEIELRNNSRGNSASSHGGSNNRGRPFPYRSLGQGGNSSSVPMELGQAEIEEGPDHDDNDDHGEQTVHAVSGHQSHSGRRLTPEQVKEFMRRGICFTCEKPGHVSRFCPKKANKPQAQQKNA